MKRAKDRWTSGHLAVGILFLSCLVLPQAFAAKATSLFRTTTTTTTTEAPEPAEVEEGADPEAAKNVTKPASKYTGIPQKDYIYDPNLPRELNGYNLSSYPFLETVPPPEEIKFRCDGLHDGFYAGVEYKCQVYHHCLYGVRVDFLCANYTAFDQKTFICHFVSEIDCVNSHKYYSKNDDLYKATTARPVPTTPTTTTTTVATPPPPAPSRPRQGGRRRPSRRRRPQYDYYDDDYPLREDDYYDDDRRMYSEGRGGSRRRKRPRPAQRRPVYDEDYDDDRYERRPEGRTRATAEDYDDRRSYDRPRKGTSRRPIEDRDKPEVRKPLDEDEDFRPRKPLRPSTSPDSGRRTYEDDRRERPRRPKPLRGDLDEEDIPVKDDREERPRNRPFRDEKPYKDAAEKDSPLLEERPYREDRPLRERPTYRDETRDRPYRNEGRNRNDDKNEDRSYVDDKKIEPTAGGALVKPAGGSIFSKPRVAPKIARPVPSSEKDKFAYVTEAPTTAAPVEEEYYDDYEIEDPKSTSPSIKSSMYSRSRPEPVEREKFKPKPERNRSNFDLDAPKRLSGASGNTRQRRPDNIQDVRRPVDDEEEYEDFEDVRPRRPAPSRVRNEGRYAPRKKPARIEEDYYYDDEDYRKDRKNEDRHTISTRAKEMESGELSSEIEGQNHKAVLHKNRDVSTTTTTTSTTTSTVPTTTTTTSTTTTEAPTTVKTGKAGFVRIVKRPFLPSRGGSPYLPRGLQPLGGKSDKTTQLPTTSTTTSTTAKFTPEKPSADYIYEIDYDSKDDKLSPSGKNPAENNSEEYEQTDQAYEVNENPKETEKYTQSDRQLSYTQDKDTQNREAPKKENHDSYESDRNVPMVEKQATTPSGLSNFRPNSQYDEQNTRPEQVNKDVFIPSPQISDPYTPTNKPYTPRIPEHISIKQNLADPIENDYDVTLNDALNPTLPNLTPVRNYPSPFNSPERDYTFARFRNSNYQDPSLQQSNNYQYRNQNTNSGKYNSNPSRRYQGSYTKNVPVVDSSFAASEITGRGVSVRTPESYYLQPRYQQGYAAEETNSGLRQSHVNYRQVSLGDYYA